MGIDLSIQGFRNAGGKVLAFQLLLFARVPEKGVISGKEYSQIMLHRSGSVFAEEACGDRGWAFWYGEDSCFPKSDVLGLLPPTP